MYYPLICLPLTTMIVCPGRMVDKGLLSGIPLGSLEKGFIEEVLPHTQVGNLIHYLPHRGIVKEESKIYIPIRESIFLF